MRIAIVEDHLLVRDVLRRACAELGHEVVAESALASPVPELIAGRNAELMILDLQLPDADGLEVIEAARARRPGLPVLILSSRCDAYTVYRLDRLGVSGFVDKDNHTLAMIGAALQAVANGRTYFAPAYLAARAARRADPSSFDKILSDREQTILRCLCRGQDDAATARVLGISPATAEKHRFNIQRKLGLRSTAEVVRWGRKLGFGS